MTFDLFISYAHMDNEPLTAEQQGWVTRFHTSLQAMLSPRIGRKAEIWRDLKLTGNDVFGPEILEQLPKTALLVSVLSPCYLGRKWCTDEVWEFYRMAEQSGGARLGNKSRIIKVIKLPVENIDVLPPLVKQELGYDFYDRVRETEAPVELDPNDPIMTRKYRDQLARLCWDVAEVLKRLKTADPAEETSSSPQVSKPSIYLAECSSEHKDARAAVEAELKLMGYPVLPDRQLPTDETGYASKVAQLLAQCSLSIHLVGDGTGWVPDGPSQKSVVVLQNELAVERSKSGRLPRVIWLPEGTKSQHPDQQHFIEQLNKDPGTQFGADLITGDIETLKAAIHAALKNLEKPAPSNAQPERVPGSPKLIYLMCVEHDRPATRSLRKSLRDRGLQVELPVFQGDAATVRRTNQDLLADCDAALLFYGAGDEAWKRTMENDLRKINGFGRKKPMLASYVYLAEPATDDKKDLIEFEEPNLINGLSEFSEEVLKPFLEAVDGRYKTVTP